MRFGQSGDTKSKEAGETEKESDGDIPEQKKVGRFHARHVSCLELGGHPDMMSPLRNERGLDLKADI